MVFDQLRAKSRRAGSCRHDPPTILEHTAEVMAAAERLVRETGQSQLRALGLDPVSWFERLAREILLAAFLHDLGKANDHFQGMVWGTRSLPQTIRHEAISFWIAMRPEIQEWIRPA